MLTFYKNTFYKNGSAFKESEPPSNELPKGHDFYVAVKPKNGKIEQIRFGADYVKNNVDINVTFKTFYAKEQPESIDNIWITYNLPNNKHIDWVIYKDKIKLEHYIKGYGYTDYLFQTIYKGKTDDLTAQKFSNVCDDQIWLYDCDHKKKNQKYLNVTDISNDFNDIFTISREILTMIENYVITTELVPKEISDNYSVTLCKNFDVLLDKINKINIVTHPIFKKICDVQCYVQNTNDMFKLPKFWEKEKK